MSGPLKHAIATAKCQPCINHAVLYANLFQRQNVRTVTFDRAFPKWFWDRTYPRGIIELEADPKGITYAAGKPVLLMHHLAQSAMPRTFVLKFGDAAVVEEGEALAAAAAASGEELSADVLIAAPDRLLGSPSHPFYAMEPTVWIPFAPLPDVDFFVAPYFRGLFNTRFAWAQLGDVALNDAVRGPLFHPSKTGPFRGALYYGSVVSCRVSLGQGMEEDFQGVVVLHYIKFSEAAGSKYMEFLAQSALGDSAKPLPPTVAAAFRAMPLRAPVPCLAIWPFSMPATSSTAAAAAASDSTCWQVLAKEDSGLRHVRTSDVTRIWKTDELGSWATVTGEPLLNLLHRTTEDGDPIELHNPAQPTRLRQAISQPFVQRAVAAFVRDAAPMPSQGAEDAVRDFLRTIRERAKVGFPVDDLLNARGAINCTQPLAKPGRFSGPLRARDLSPGSQTGTPGFSPPPPTGLTAAATGRNKKSRTAAATGAQLTSEVAKAEANTGGGATGKDSKGGAGTKRSRGKGSNAGGGGSGGRSTKGRATSRGSGRGAAAAAAAGESEATSSTSKSITDAEKLERAKELFMLLADPFKPENLAPLSAVVWESWRDDAVFDADLHGPKLEKEIDAWKEYLWDQLEKKDAQLYHFLREQVLSSKHVAEEEVERVVEKLGSKAGCGLKSGATWRREYKPRKAPNSDVQLLYGYTEGEHPGEDAQSIYEMHCSGVWYGKQMDKCHPPPGKAGTVAIAAAAAAAAARGGKKPPVDPRKGQRGASAAASVTVEDTIDLSQSDDDEGGGSTKRLRTAAGAAAAGGAAASRTMATRTTAPIMVISPTPTGSPEAPSTPVMSSSAAAAAAQRGSGRMSSRGASQPGAAAAGASLAATQTASTPVLLGQAAALQTAQAEGTGLTAALLTVLAQTQATLLQVQQRGDDRADRAEAANRDAQAQLVNLATATQQTFLQLVRNCHSGGREGTQGFASCTAD
jgi:hypothetical protein